MRLVQLCLNWTIWTNGVQLYCMHVLYKAKVCSNYHSVKVFQHSVFECCRCLMICLKKMLRGMFCTRCGCWYCLSSTIIARLLKTCHVAPHWFRRPCCCWHFGRADHVICFVQWLAHLSDTAAELEQGALTVTLHNNSKPRVAANLAKVHLQWCNNALHFFTLVS